MWRAACASPLRRQTSIIVRRSPHEIRRHYIRSVSSPAKKGKFVTSGVQQHWTATSCSPCAPVLGYVSGCSWPIHPVRTACEMAVAAEESAVVAVPASEVVVEETRWQEIKRKVLRALRLIRRVLKLSIALAPIVAFYPLQKLLNRRNTEMDAQDIVLAAGNEPPLEGPLGWYLELCLWCVEWSGAAVIKMMQWAGSRPDLFGQDFCNVFCRLQDDTRPHHWKHTERVMREAYGDDWQKRIQLYEILGSGCIGQVYRGVVMDKNGKKQDVAVKVIHPNTEDDIEADLDVMRFSVRAIKRIPFDLFTNLKWLNMEGIVEEMATKLTAQLDCRVEAYHLERFNENFVGDETVTFPKLVDGYAPTKDVLIETFCDGIPILQFARENRENREMLSALCFRAIQVVCKMIFKHNFMHGDLHPGNVFVSTKDEKIILLDVGIVNEYTDDDHQLIVDILAAFIFKEGRQAGRLMIDDSNSRLMRSTNPDVAVNEEKYIDKIEALTIKASGKDYLMEHLGTYITYICNAAADHHVMMNPSFVSAALGVKVQEGIALALDPSIEIWEVATPIILSSKNMFQSVSDKASSAAMQRIHDWIKDNTGRDVTPRSY